ncbi:hypothetical protein Efla_006866 [Eimeria flavescens]
MAFAAQGTARFLGKCRLSRSALLLLLAGLAVFATVSFASEEMGAKAVLEENAGEDVAEAAEQEVEVETSPDLDAEAALTAPEQKSEKAGFPVGKALAVGSAVAIALMLLKSLFGKSVSIDFCIVTVPKSAAEVRVV